jgi:hypothetical protein
MMQIISRRSLAAATVGLGVMAAGLFTGVVYAADCLAPGTLFCDDFRSGIEFKDQDAGALWFRYANGDDPSIAKYQPTADGLRLKINTNSSDTNYSNSNISTSEINNGFSPFLRFKVNTRAEARMRFDPQMQAASFNPGSAKGSAGFLYWNYFKSPVDPETGFIYDPQDVFGFVWQDGQSTLPGLKALGLVDGQFALYQPLDSVDMSVYNTYAIERRHTSIKYFVNDVLVAEIPLNQPGTLQLSDDRGLAADAWTDNASYQYNLGGGVVSANLLFHHLPEDQNVDVSYVKVISLD